MRFTRRYNVGLAFGLALTVVLAWIVSVWIQGGAAYMVKAAVFFFVVSAAVAGVAGDRHPYGRFGPANVVTTIRVALAALAAGLIGHAASQEVMWGVVALTALMVALDGLDGWLARSTGMASPYGARFDMETDAAFIMVLSILVWQQGKAGTWVMLCGLMRYGFVAAGWLLPWLAAPLRTTLRGRAVAVGQVVGLGLALAPSVRVPASAMVAAVTLAALAWSFAMDVAWLSRRYRTLRE